MRSVKVDRYRHFCSLSHRYGVGSKYLKRAQLKLPLLNPDDDRCIQFLCGLNHAARHHCGKCIKMPYRVLSLSCRSQNLFQIN